MIRFRLVLETRSMDPERTTCVRAGFSPPASARPSPGAMAAWLFIYTRKDTAAMRPTGAVVLLFGVAFLLGSLVAVADDTFPSDLRIVANDEYTKQASVGQNASFVWALVNVGPPAYNATPPAGASSPHSILAPPPPPPP